MRNPSQTCPSQHWVMITVNTKISGLGGGLIAEITNIACVAKTHGYLFYW